MFAPLRTIGHITQFCAILSKPNHTKTEGKQTIKQVSEFKFHPEHSTGVKEREGTNRIMPIELFIDSIK